MPPPFEFLSESLPSASRTVRPGSTPESLWTVNQRLVSAEQELRAQSTQIAQLQAQLDLVLEALRRSSDGGHVDERQRRGRPPTRSTSPRWSSNRSGVGSRRPIWSFTPDARSTRMWQV